VGNFFGTYQRTLDDKKRLQIPSKFVKEMPRCFYVLRGFEGCLAIYEESEFQALLGRLQSLSFLDETARSYIRLATSSANELEVDGHGRITLGSELTAAYRIGNDVTLIGVLDHFEIWDSAAYRQYLSERAPSYEDLAMKSAH
jgi:MraZ protein